MKCCGCVWEVTASAAASSLSVRLTQHSSNSQSKPDCLKAEEMTTQTTSSLSPLCSICFHFHLFSTCLNRYAKIHPCVRNPIHSCLINFPLNIFSQSGTVQTRAGFLLSALYVPTVRREAEQNVWSCVDVDSLPELIVKYVSYHSVLREPWSWRSVMSEAGTPLINK